MALRIKNFNTLGFHWKTWLLGGGGGCSQKINREGGLPKKVKFANLRGLGKKEEEVFLRGVSLYTMSLVPI